MRVPSKSESAFPSCQNLFASITRPVVVPRGVRTNGGVSDALGVRGGASPPSKDVATPSVKSEESFLEVMAARLPSAFSQAMLGLGTGEVSRVAQACSGLMDAVESGQAAEVRLGFLFTKQCTSYFKRRTFRCPARFHPNFFES